MTIRALFLIALSAGVLLTAAGASAQQKGGKTKGEKKSAVKESPIGTIDIELFTNDAPKTTDNFMKLAERKYFNGVLFHRVANTLNYLDIKTVVVSCGTCYDQLQGYKFEDIFPGCRIVDIHEFLLDKGIRLEGNAEAYLYHDPCHSPMKLREPMKTVKALVGEHVRKSERCCGESGTLGVTRPDIATQVRFRKTEELQRDEAALRASGAVPETGNLKILTSCPSCLQGLTRYTGDLDNGLLEADYIVVEMANRILGADWMPEYVQRANNGGIERVLV